MEIIKHFRLGNMVNNAFLISLDNKFILIDAPDGVNKVISFLDDISKELDEVWLTHCHFDHIVGLNDLKKKYPKLKVFSSAKELDKVNNIEDNYSKEFLGFDFNYNGEIYDNDILLKEHKNLSIEYISGHSYCSSVYIFNDVLMMFSGDVLFRETIGRSDLKYGDFNSLNQGIKTKLFKYPNETKVYPGHGFSTSIEYEKENNKVII